ncbi:MAG: hypothetical protein M3Y59_02065 [Myxococcota bacterium]|nr:hypothetical protein [Myxococcota bacterium]
MRTMLAVTVVLALFSPSAQAQYSRAAGQNAPTQAVEREVRDQSTGKVIKQTFVEPVAKDGHGNARGNDFDLAVDGAFDGQTIAVIHLYMDGQFDFGLPKQALKEKGFSLYRWVGKAPSPKELEEALKKSCQLWIIADSQRHLNDEHATIIKRFFDAGHGVYIWGDNEPYYADANFIAQKLFGASMSGNLMGDQTVGLEKAKGGQTVGLKRRHLLSTGLEYIYEGVTIATIAPNDALQPLIYGSAGNLVAAYYEKNGKRAILDGGFTRLYVKWDTAGTGRYVKNAAAWLVNAERFGPMVLGPAARAEQGGAAGGSR